MKKTILALSLVLSVLLACLSMSLIVSADAGLVITTETVDAIRGETVNVVLNVEKNDGFAALLINVPENEGIEVVGYKNGTVMVKMTEGANVLWDASSDSTETGALLTVTFKISEDAQFGDHVINVKALQCFNDSDEAVSVSIEPIVINVLAEEIPTESVELPPVIDTEVETDTEVDTDTVTGDGEEESSEFAPPASDSETNNNDAPVEEDTESDSADADSTDKESSNKNGSGCSSFVSGAVVSAVAIAVGLCFVVKKKD